MDQPTPRTRSRPTLVVLAVVVGLVVLVTGSLGWYRWSGQARVLTTDSGLHVVVGERGYSAMLAAFDAEVTRVGRCLGLGGSTTVWPHGTRVDGDRVRVGGRSYGIGDRFRGGGGVLESADLDLDAPPGCPVTREVTIVNDVGW